jgi:hypothetical protein
MVPLERADEAEKERGGLGDFALACYKDHYAYIAENVDRWNSA